MFYFPGSFLSMIFIFCTKLDLCCSYCLIDYVMSYNNHFFHIDEHISNTFFMLKHTDSNSFNSLLLAICADSNNFFPKWYHDKQPYTNYTLCNHQPFNHLAHLAQNPHSWILNYWIKGFHVFKEDIVTLFIMTSFQFVFSLTACESPSFSTSTLRIIKTSCCLFDTPICTHKTISLLWLEKQLPWNHLSPLILTIFSSSKKIPEPWEGCDVDVSFRAEYFPVSYSLYIEHQTVSMLIAVLLH